MRKILLVATATLLAAACGTKNSTSKVAALATPAASAATVAAYTVKGQIESVKLRAAEAPAVGFWTDVTISYTIRCYEELASFAYTTRNAENGKIEILATAIATSSLKRGHLVCQALSQETRVVSLPDLVAAEDLTLVNLKGTVAEFDLVENYTLSTDINFAVIEVSPRCNANECNLSDTIVKLRANLGCLDQMGPVSYIAKQNKQLGTVELIVSGLALKDHRSFAVFCKRLNYVDTVITLPNIAVDESKIELTVVK